jgi:thioredoxin 1
MAQETTDAKFKEDVLESEQPVLVDFWAPWCGPCKLVGPIIDSVSDKAAGKAKVFKVNVDNNPLVSQAFNITGIPTVIVFREGNADQTFVGVQQESVYLRALGL